MSWPPHERSTRPWRQRSRAGTREDRMLSEVTVWIPPLIADRAVSLPPELSVTDPLSSTLTRAGR